MNEITVAGFWQTAQVLGTMSWPVGIRSKRPKYKSGYATWPHGISMGVTRQMDVAFLPWKTEFRSTVPTYYFYGQHSMAKQLTGSTGMKRQKLNTVITHPLNNSWSILGVFSVLCSPMIKEHQNNCHVPLCRDESTKGWQGAAVANLFKWERWTISDFAPTVAKHGLPLVALISNHDLKWEP